MNPEEVVYSSFSPGLSIKLNRKDGSYTLTFVESNWLVDSRYDTFKGSMTYPSFHKADCAARDILARFEYMRQYKYHPERQKELEKELNRLRNIGNEVRKGIANEIKSLFT